MVRENALGLVLEHLNRLDVQQLQGLGGEQDDCLHAADLAGVYVDLPEPAQNFQERLHLCVGQQVLGQSLSGLAALQHRSHVKGHAPLGQIEQKQLLPRLLRKGSVRCLLINTEYHVVSYLQQQVLIGFREGLKGHQAPDPTHGHEEEPCRRLL